MSADFDACVLSFTSLACLAGGVTTVPLRFSLRGVSDLTLGLRGSFGFLAFPFGYQGFRRVGLLLGDADFLGLLCCFAFRLARRFARIACKRGGTPRSLPFGESWVIFRIVGLRLFKLGLSCVRSRAQSISKTGLKILHISLPCIVLFNIQSRDRYLRAVSLVIVLA